MYWGKYNVTQSMFPPLHFYPDYCNGQCALLNRPAVEARVSINYNNLFYSSKPKLLYTITVIFAEKL